MSLAIDRLAQASRWRGHAVAEKSLLALGLLTLALALPPWPGAALSLAVAWGVALFAARVPWRDWLRLVAAPAGFLLVAALALLVEIGPDGPALARDQGRAALDASLRAGAAVSALLLLAATTPAPDLLRAARRIGLPATIAEMALLIWRFVFLLLDAAQAIRAAQEARLGWHGTRRRLRSLGLLVALLLPRALDRARRMEVGLAARGFDGSFRTLAPARPARPAVLAAEALLLAAVAGGGVWLS
mgnify:CR=1 FL=1